MRNVNLVPAAQAGSLEVLSHRYWKDGTQQIVNGPGNFSARYLFQGVPRIELVTLAPKIVHDLIEIKWQIKMLTFDSNCLRCVGKTVNHVLRRQTTGISSVANILTKLEISRI